MKFKKSAEPKLELNMTPMIDIVFQLLTFFVFSLKIVSNEGDFGIKMPLGVSQGVAENLLPPIKVRMLSNSDGKLAGIRMNDRAISSFDALRLEVIGIVGNDSGPGSVRNEAEVELDCDPNLNYEHVIEAISSVSGYVDNNKNIIKLIEKIKFAPPRA